MGIGVSLLLMAAGAVLAFAIDVEESGGFNINTIGVILMIVGAIGLLASMVFWSSVGRAGFGRRRVIEEDY